MKPETNKDLTNAFNVLIVDDDPTCIFLAETHLKNHFKLHSVNNGHAALEAVEKTKYAVILMDINLKDPAMDGLKVMRTIRYNRKYRYTKIVAVTSSTDGGEWLIKQGFDGHYQKPLVEKEIVEEIHRQISSVPLFRNAGIGK